MKTYTLPLASPEAVLETVGGKGMSLSKLARAGLPVPGGFHITTSAYRCFVAENGLQAQIDAALANCDPAQPETLTAASAAINGAFLTAWLPADLITAITGAWSALGEDTFLAVRSSATAEDLPELSFAGQQETYLNVHGIVTLLEAVKKCWASLWTERAIAYRQEHNIAHADVTLAVVVQQLVFADAAGVLFSANPLNGQRGQAMITAAWGLGEAIVSGAVSPDTLVVDKASLKVIESRISPKEVMTVRLASGVQEQAVPPAQRKKAVLSAAQAGELTRLACRIEALYGLAVDVEWALTGGQIALLQARPITALPEAGPGFTWERPDKHMMYARGSLVELIPDPVTPLFASLAIPIASDSYAQLFYNMLNPRLAPKVRINYSVINGYAYNSMGTSFSEIMILFGVSLAQTKKMLAGAARRWREEGLPKYRAEVEKWKDTPTETLQPGQILAGIKNLFQSAVDYYCAIQSSIIPGANSSEALFSTYYNKLIKRQGDPQPASLLFGFENFSLRAEKALFDLAESSRQRPELVRYLSETPAWQITADLHSPTPTPALSSADFDYWNSHFNTYLKTYGYLIYNLDFANPLPLESPEMQIETLKIYLSGQGKNPYQRQQETVTTREATIERIGARLGGQRRKWFFKLLRWAQEYAPLREDGIAELGLAYPMVRAMLGELGRRLAQNGAIATPEEIHWLNLDEVRRCCELLEAGQPLPSYKEAISSRQTLWQAQRKITPPNMLPEKSPLSKLVPGHVEIDGNTLKGYGASAGKVSGRACVMLGPEDFKTMQPGDVIVAVTTTPAWTPLFARAAAVVTDIGGPLSHSSIVAREYGIPAVMSTGSATRRIRSGQIITVDGSSGCVMLP